jgi:endonuclease/exonuclease/phosphatase family metal-dependent hydrolase
VPEITVASFNTHAAMDGWGRPYDLAEACRALEADVIVLQEVFAPLNGRSQAEELAGVLGYSCHELPLARSWRRANPIWHGKGWEPRKTFPNYQKALKVGGRISGAERPEGYEEGTWGLAVLSRRPVIRTEALELGTLRRDFTWRGALLVEVGVQGGPGGSGGLAGSDGSSFTVVGTHAAHLTSGSPIQFRRLRESLPGKSTPAALAGDMNLWGPPLTLLLPAWRRAVKGRTWPARRPHSQPDHILVTRVVEVLEASVVRAGNSDHLPLRTALSW